MPGLEQLSTWIEEIITGLGYPGLAFVMFAENVFPPIPSELVMPYAGFLVATGDDFTLPGILIAGTIGSVLGAIVLYYVGVLVDEAILRRFLRRYGKWLTVSESDLDRALALFDRYGPFIIFFGRLIPLIRSIISIPAGVDRMPMPKFLLYTTAGSLIWNGILGYGGYVLGDNWERITHTVETYQSITLVVLAVMGLGVIYWWFKRFRAQQAAAPASE